MAFDFNHIEELRQQQIEEDEQQAINEDRYEDEDEEEPIDFAPTEDADDEIDFDTDFIRDIVHPTVTVDEIVAEIEFLEEEVAHHFLSSDALALEHDQEHEQAEQVETEDQTTTDYENFDSLEDFIDTSFQSADQILAEVQQLESELYDQLDSDDVIALTSEDQATTDSVDNELDHDNTEPFTTIETTDDSVTQLLLSKQVEEEVQPLLTTEPELETEIIELVTPVEQEVSEQVDQELQEHQQDLPDLQSIEEHIKSQQSEQFDKLEQFDHFDYNDQISSEVTMEVLLIEQELQAVNYSLPDVIPEEVVITLDGEISLQQQEIDELTRDIASVERSLSSSQPAHNVHNNHNSSFLDEESSFLHSYELDFSKYELDSVPVFSSLELDHESDLSETSESLESLENPEFLESLLSEQAAILEDIGPHLSLDPEELTLNELNDLTQKQVELDGLQELIELASLYSRMDDLTIDDFKVFEDELLFQQYSSSVLTGHLSSNQTLPSPHFLSLSLNDSLVDFSSQSVDAEVSALSQLFLDLEVSRILEPLQLESSDDFSYILPHSYVQYLEELEFIYAQSDKAAPRSSISIVGNFEKAREVQLQASMSLAGAGLPQEIQETQEKVDKELESFSNAVTIPTYRGVVKDQIEALEKLLTFDFHLKPNEPTTRIIQVTANSPEEMISIYLDKSKLGDFTQEADVINPKINKRSLGRLVKEPIWQPLRHFVIDGKFKKEIQNSVTGKTDWVVFNRRKDWVETGRQLKTIELKMNLFNYYYSQLEVQARTLAKDTEQTRVTLSKMSHVPDIHQQTLEFWKSYGYRPPAEIFQTNLWPDQNQWVAHHKMIDGNAIFQSTLHSQQFANLRLKNHVDPWVEQHPILVQNSLMGVKKSQELVSLNSILPVDLQRNPTLICDNCSIDILNENRGGPEMFRHMLNYHLSQLNFSSRNPLVEYLGLKPSDLVGSEVLTEWGKNRNRDKSVGMDEKGRKFKDTFAPDIVVEGSDGNIQAVIQLKGRSQDSYNLIATSSFFQMIELMKYHVENKVPVALVNIKQESDSVEYEWMVIGKANTPPLDWMKDIINAPNGLDPLIPRNTRSHDFSDVMYQEFMRNEGSINYDRMRHELSLMVKGSQEEFQNLPFQKQTTKTHQVDPFWEQVIREFKRVNITYTPELKSKEFFKLWKPAVVRSFEEYLKQIKL